MMKPDLYSEVVLARDFPEHQLKRGDMATVVEYVQHPEGGEEGCILEIFNVLGESIAVVTVPVSAVERLRADQVPAVRTLAKVS
jgi:hypothetical protein